MRSVQSSYLGSTRAWSSLKPKAAAPHTVRGNPGELKQSPGRWRLGPNPTPRKRQRWGGEPVTGLPVAREYARLKSGHQDNLARNELQRCLLILCLVRIWNRWGNPIALAHTTPAANRCGLTDTCAPTQANHSHKQGQKLIWRKGGRDTAAI